MVFFLNHDKEFKLHGLRKLNSLGIKTYLIIFLLKTRARTLALNFFIEHKLKSNKFNASLEIFYL